MRRFLPRGWPFLAFAICWNTYPFRIIWIGFWEIAYDRSGRFYERWPHIVINWNDD